MGVILLAIVASGLLDAAPPTYWALIATGVVLIVAMTIDDIRQRRSAVR